MTSLDTIYNTLSALSLCVFPKLLTESDKIRHRFVDGTAKDTRVKIPVRPRNLDLVIVDTSETISETGGLGVKPVIVYIRQS